MVNIDDRDYLGNPVNMQYVFSATKLDMDWKKFRDLYEKLHENPKKELDNFLTKLYHMEAKDDLRNLIHALDRIHKDCNSNPCVFGNVKL